MESTTKENFVAIWKKISNHPNIKPKMVEVDSYNGKVKIKQKGWIHPEHHLIYNVVRGKKISLGFYCGETATEGFNDAVFNLKKFSPTQKWTFNMLFTPFKEYIPEDEFVALLSEIQAKL